MLDPVPTPTPLDPTPPVQCKDPEAPPYPPTGNYKKIFVFLDGTGNKFMDDVDNGGGNSNVVKLYTTLRVGLEPGTGIEQIAYYHPGVGTMGDPAIRRRIPRWWSKVKGLAFGAGFRDNVLDAYRYLMNVYNDGDQIYIFGFSRGAYTARTLAALLHGCGLLCPGNEGHPLYAWSLFLDELSIKREGLKLLPWKRKRPKQAHTIERKYAFTNTFSRIVTVRFMGVWDTVSSVGWIFSGIRLLDMAQNPIIQVGRHAVSIDERRAFYRDNLWGENVKINDPEWPQVLASEGIQQDLAQVWFPGVHSDIGGSYPQLEAAPANQTLEWMIGELQNHGAVLCQNRIRTVLGGFGPDQHLDRVYPLPKPPGNQIHNSLDWKWWPLQLIPQQYYAKDCERIQWRVPFGRPRALPNLAIIHGSAITRMDNAFPGQPAYAPTNINRKQIYPVTARPETKANLTGCYEYINLAGEPSVLSDPRPLRYLKLTFGWLYFGLFWLIIAALLALAIALIPVALVVALVWIAVCLFFKQIAFTRKLAHRALKLLVG